LGNVFNRAVIRFKSGEKTDSLYDEDVWAAVLDEASRMREEAFHAIRSTLTATRGKVRLIGNAKGRKNWPSRCLGNSDFSGIWDCLLQNFSDA
jgi:hypothetical protein